MSNGKELSDRLEKFDLLLDGLQALASVSLEALDRLPAAAVPMEELTAYFVGGLRREWRELHELAGRFTLLDPENGGNP